VSAKARCYSETGQCVNSRVCNEDDRCMYAEPPVKEGKPMEDRGPCEAEDWFKTDDDAIFVVCGAPGRRVVETNHRGMKRTRLACPAHAVDYENSPS